METPVEVAQKRRADVDTDEQPRLRLLTAIVDVDPDAQPSQVSIGMPVEVCFEASGDAWIPLFRPVLR